MGSSNSTTSKPASAISKPRLRSLKSGTCEDIADTTVKYKIVQEITRKALQLLSTPEGKSSLVQVARIIVRETDQDQLAIKEEEFRQRPTWYIDRFLSAVAEEFPNIDLKAMHSDSQSTLYDWGTNVEKYSPRAHGYLELNETVCFSLHHPTQLNAPVLMIDTSRYLTRWIAYTRAHPKMQCPIRGTTFSSS